MNADFLFLFSGEKFTIWNIHKGRPHSNCWDHHQQTHLASLLLKGVIEIYRSYFDQNLAQSCYHVT